MSPLRTLVVLFVLAALGVLGISTGFARIEALRESRRAELVEATRRGHLDAARRLLAFVERARRQVAYAAELDAAAALLAESGAQDPDARGRLASFLEAFHELDALELRDSSGALRLRLLRADDASASESSAPWLTATVHRDGVALGELHARLALDAFERLLESSHLLEGVRDRLLPEDPRGPVAREARDGLLLLPPRDEPEGLLLRSRLAQEPALRVETLLPDAALDAAMEPLRREYRWIITSMIGFAVLVALLGAVVLGLSQRAFRLRETEHYLRWIRRVTDRYRALMEGAADMILIVEPESLALREANAAARETLALAALDPAAVPAAAPPPALGDLLAGDGGERVRAALAEVAARGGRVAVPGLRLYAASGRLLDVDSGFALVDVGDERVVQVSLRDVTQQREMERQLQTAERLGSLGLLTAGVAHEINNPLEGIGNYLALAERPTLEPERRTRYLGEVRRGLARIRDIVQDLLSFARPVAASGRADLARVVESALGLSAFARELRGVEVERSGLDGELLVPGDAGRLEQVVLNLVLNAARAMEGKGRLVLAARRASDDRGAWIELDVADEGPGIPPEDLARIFDPFFSRHSGTGLGLTVSFGIARAHGGTLSARNRPEGGAVFTLRLPAGDAAATFSPDFGAESP